MSVTEHPPKIDYPSLEGAEWPWPVFNRLRDEFPIYQIPDRPNLFILSRYDDIRYAFGKPEIFSSHASRSGLNGMDLLLSTPSSAGKVMIETDPPHHKPKRDLAFPALKPGRLKLYAEMIEQIADELIDSFADDGGCEFVEQFAAQLPTRLTLRLMGVPEDDIPWVRLWAKFEASGLSWMPEDFREEQKRTGERMFEYLTEKILERRERLGDDVISVIIQEQLKRDGDFDVQEVRAQTAVLLGGGVVTTAHFLSSCMHYLLANPGELAKVQADHAKIPRMIEEMLRLEPPAMWNPRRVAVNTELRGVKIPAESYLILLQAAGNRDERKFDDPDRFDVDRRDAHEHLSFGYGPHFCLGAPLARLETRIAFERLLARLGEIRLAGDNDFKHIQSPSFRGLRKLNIEFGPVPRSA